MSGGHFVGNRTAEPKIFSRKFCELVPRPFSSDGEEKSRGPPICIIIDELFPLC